MRIIFKLLNRLSTLLHRISRSNSAMDNFDLDYSGKNIPIPSTKEYIKCLLEKIESVIKRMRWKAFFFLNNSSDTDSSSDDEEKDTETYGFKSKKTPPQISEMVSFEKDLFNLIDNINYRQVSDTFQSQLKEDVKKINSSDKVFVKADKTRNMYTLDKDNYCKLLKDNITQKYKVANQNIVRDIEIKTDVIADKLNIEDRINKPTNNPSFVTIKDHKENFQHNTKCRLINPNKPEIGRASKIILERINNDIRSKTNLNQWRCTSAVLELKNKDKSTFMIFDIVDFYPSISQELLDKYLEWAKGFTHIQPVEYETIMHSRRTILYDNNKKPWIKKDTQKEFDVSMGAYDGAEVCELVGLYMLKEIKENINLNSLGLYRDDGLAYMENVKGHNADKMRKELVKIFKNAGLNITVHTNLKIVNYLDVTLNLDEKLYKPYKKPNDEPQYINKLSNHPP